MAMKWHGIEALARIRKSAADRVDKAARFVRDAAKEKLSVAGKGMITSVYGAGGGHYRILYSGTRAAAREQARDYTAVSKYGAQLRGGTRKQKTKYNRYKARRRRFYIPSAPGQAPHKDTGHLRMNVRKETNKASMTTNGPWTAEARVGTNVPYGKWLEFGTRKMRARPWLRRTLNENIGEIRRLLGYGEVI